MDYNLFIIPITLIVVELIKRAELVNTKYLPILAVCFGAIAGASFGLYYQVDLFEHIFMGIVFGASASGVYDTGKTAVKEV